MSRFRLSRIKVLKEPKEQVIEFQKPTSIREFRTIVFVSIGHNKKNQFEALTLIEFEFESGNHKVLALKQD